MTSLINPNNIDGTYPVAGQDNNSQGFRDNFTNIQTNFEYAASEITDLQSKAVLKQALSGTVVDNDMLGTIISNAQLQDMAYTRRVIGVPPTSSLIVNYADGVYQTIETGQSLSVSFTGFPPAAGTSPANIPTAGELFLTINVTSTSHTVTFTAPTGWINGTGIRGLSFTSGTSALINFASTGFYTFQFVSYDGGNTITINEVNKSLQPFNNSSELLAASGASSLALTTSYFQTTTTGETNTLAAGVNGQIKVLAYFSEANSGDTRIVTVTNAGWKSSGTGTVTFTEFGQTATLMYINNKWFVTGMGPGASDTLPTLA